MGWTLNGALPRKQAATVASKIGSIADDRLSNQIFNWWDCKSYATFEKQTANNQDFRKKNLIER